MKKKLLVIRNEIRTDSDTGKSTKVKNNLAEKKEKNL